jgi:hypothetical protein
MLLELNRYEGQLVKNLLEAAINAYVNGDSEQALVQEGGPEMWTATAMAIRDGIDEGLLSEED